MTTTSTHAFKAQHGEDRLLAEYFQGKNDGFYVEVGAYNGVDISNTHYFEGLGWRGILGILVEADPDLAQQCRVNRPGATIVNCAVVLR